MFPPEQLRLRAKPEEIIHDKQISRSSEDKVCFRVGDRVRIYRYKSHFEKGYKPNWTREIYKVVKVLPATPITYKIEDLNGESVIGRFYAQELLSTAS